jgi:hypothetical protein
LAAGSVASAWACAALLHSIASCAAAKANAVILSGCLAFVVSILFIIFILFICFACWRVTGR